MAYRVGQATFSKGEIAEELVARFDVDSYRTALRKANNVIGLKYGGVTKRPGTRFISEVYADNGVRLIPFQFSLTQTYVLELGQAYMRLAAGGGMVIEEKLTIQALTLGTTTIINAAFHDYKIGDQIYFSGVDGAVEINGKIGKVVEVISAGVYRVDIDSSSYSPFTGDTGGITRTATPPPPPPPPPVPPPSPPAPPPDLGGWNGNYGGGFLLP